jgi:hypothetical protein
MLRGCVQQTLLAEKMQAERKLDEQETQLKSQETDLKTAAKVKAELEAQLRAANEQIEVWRAKARHRHRAIEVPQFDKGKSGAKQKEQWLKERALADSLGFDDSNDKPVIVTIDAPPPVGLGLLNAKDHSTGGTHTVIHTIKEVNRLSIACMPIKFCAWSQLR